MLDSELDRQVSLLTAHGVGAARLGGSLRYDALELRQKAVAAAKDADHVIVCTGLNVSMRESWCEVKRG